MQGVDGLDDHEQHECYDEEVNDGIDEGTNADHHIAHMDADVREICVEKQADGGVDDVVHQRVDDGRERTADDNADCHIQHVAAHGKGLELFKKLFDAFHFFFCHKKIHSFTPFMPQGNVFASMIADFWRDCKGK